MAKQRYKTSHKKTDNSNNCYGSLAIADPPPMPEPVGTATTIPWLNGKSSRRRAATAALYYGEAYMQGIGMEEADLAALNSKNCYNKWWMQQHFKNCKGLGSDDHVSDDDDSPSEGQATITTAMKPAATVVPVNVQQQRVYDDDTAQTSINCCSSPIMIEKKRSKRRRTDNSVALVSRSESSVGLHRQHVGVGIDAVEKGEDARGELVGLPALVIPPPINLKGKIKEAKAALLDALTGANGETDGQPFLSALGKLEDLYKLTSLDLRGGKHSRKLDGVWLTMSNPNYQDCLGQNINGDYMYTLGRMSFDMFRPEHLRCSIQAIFNPISIAEVAPSAIPKSLREEVEEGSKCLRNYNIVVSFTIEQENGKEPNVQGIMTNYGFIVPDPNVRNRFSVWFTGGCIEPNDETDKEEWFKIFNASKAKEEIKERAKQLASKVLLGVRLSDSLEDDGSMSFRFDRPIGGHGKTYFDIIYCDRSLRLIRGQHDSIYALSKVPSSYLQS